MEYFLGPERTRGKLLKQGSRAALHSSIWTKQDHAWFAFRKCLQVSNLQSHYVVVRNAYLSPHLKVVLMVWRQHITSTLKVGTPMKWTFFYVLCAVLSGFLVFTKDDNKFLSLRNGGLYIWSAVSGFEKSRFIHMILAGSCYMKTFNRNRAALHEYIILSEGVNYM